MNSKRTVIQQISGKCSLLGGIRICTWRALLTQMHQKTKLLETFA